MAFVRNLCVVLGLALLMPGGARAAAKPPEQRLTKEGLDFFEKKIRPVLVHNCYECHSGDPAKAKGHLVLDTRDGMRKGGDSGAAIVPGTRRRQPADRGDPLRRAGDAPQGQAARRGDRRLRAAGSRWAPRPAGRQGGQAAGKIDLAEARKFWAFQPPKASPPPAGAATRPGRDRHRSVRARPAGEGEARAGGRCRPRSR